MSESDTSHAKDAGDEITKRKIDAEATIAQRMKLERTARDWSLERLAEEMRAVGCYVQAPALMKIERASGPRRIPTDEAQALALVFGTTMDELATPIRDASAARLDALMDDYRAALGKVEEARDVALDALRVVLDVASEVPELAEAGRVGAWAAKVLANSAPGGWEPPELDPELGYTSHDLVAGKSISVKVAGYGPASDEDEGGES